MPLSDEKVDQLLTVLTESMKNMQTFQTENNKLHSDLLKMMQRQMEFHESSLAAKNEIWDGSQFWHAPDKKIQ